jgi:hypothetical protein
VVKFPFILIGWLSSGEIKARMIGGLGTVRRQRIINIRCSSCLVLFVDLYIKRLIGDCQRSMKVVWGFIHLTLVEFTVGIFRYEANN